MENKLCPKCNCKGELIKNIADRETQIEHSFFKKTKKTARAEAYSEPEPSLQGGIEAISPFIIMCIIFLAATWQYIENETLFPLFLGIEKYFKYLFILIIPYMLYKAFITSQYKVNNEVESYNKRLNYYYNTVLCESCDILYNNLIDQYEKNNKYGLEKLLNNKESIPKSNSIEK